MKVSTQYALITVNDFYTWLYCEGFEDHATKLIIISLLDSDLWLVSSFRHLLKLIVYRSG